MSFEEGETGSRRHPGIFAGIFALIDNLTPGALYATESGSKQGGIFFPSLKRQREPDFPPRMARPLGKRLSRPKRGPR